MRACACVCVCAQGVEWGGEGEVGMVFNAFYDFLGTRASSFCSSSYIEKTPSEPLSGTILLRLVYYL